MRRAGEGAAVAVAFLTVLPARPRGEAPGIGAAAAWFPVVGGLVGALAGAVRAAGAPLIGPAPASVVAVATLVVVSGALHHDGLADCADGLGARGDRERRLAVMRDPAIGVFGALALVVWILLMVSVLAELGSGEALRGLIVAAAAARWAALLHAALAAPARGDGLGASFTVSAPALVVASAVAVVAAALLLGVGRGGALLLAAGLVALAVTGWARRALGGRTGDTLGATVVLAEATLLLVLLGCSGR